MFSPLLWRDIDRGRCSGSINRLLKKLIALARGKKAKDITILRMKNLNWITDYLFICSADSSIQVRAIADTIAENFNRRLRSLAGYQEGKWVLMDYGDVMVHVFHQATRNFYNLERLWADAHREKIPIRRSKCPKKKRLYREN